VRIRLRHPLAADEEIHAVLPTTRVLEEMEAQWRAGLGRLARAEPPAPSEFLESRVRGRYGVGNRAPTGGALDPEHPSGKGGFDMAKLVPNDTARKWRGLLPEPGSRALRGSVGTDQYEVAAKVAADDGELLVIKFWSQQGYACDLLFVEVETGIVIASARGGTEGEAWASCAAQARARGFKI
jgi:hypothetical protein